jgi:cytochrome P450
LREVAPVCWEPDFGEWILTRWSDCQTVLRDPRFSSNLAHSSAPMQGPVEMLRASTSRVLLFIDPPDHTRLRGLVSQAFTPRRIEAMRNRVEAIVGEIFDKVASGATGTMDLMADLAQPLPVIVICELLGVPVEDHEKFGPWSSAASRLLDGDLDEETMMRSLAGAAELITYFQELFQRRRDDPADDLLTALVQAEAEGDRLDEEELMSITVLLFIAGHETTSNLIGNGTLALLRHPQQAARLLERADDQAFVRNAVEELLRFDPPVQLTGRFATTDLEVAGVPIAKGEAVVTVVAAANRDPEHYALPERLDLERPDPHHLGFSQGIHYCLGAALARLEGEVVFPALLRRYPSLRLATDTPTYRDHRVLRGLAALPVTW